MIKSYLELEKVYTVNDGGKAKSSLLSINSNV